MRALSIAVTLGLLLVSARALVLPTTSRPPCDSPDVEAAAMVAQDFLNAQHTHGYKYVLNRIDDIKIITTPNGDATYFLDVELLETRCHVLDPTPLVNCSVRPKVLTAVEGDCDVVLKKVGGVLSVSAFKCKTEESTEDMCLGCPTLLPLNHTSGLDFVQQSLAMFNSRLNRTFSVMEVGRMSQQLVSQGHQFVAEYVITEAECVAGECVPLDNGEQGFCVAQGLGSDPAIVCNMFAVLSTNASEFNTIAASVLPVIHATHGLNHHKLTHIHDPELTGLLSAESVESIESAEVVQVMQVVPESSHISVPADAPPTIVDAVKEVAAPSQPAGLPVVNVEVPVKDLPDEVMPAVEPSLGVDLPAGDDATKAVVVKREVASVGPDVPASIQPLLLVPLCPGRIRHY